MRTELYNNTSHSVICGGWYITHMDVIKTRVKALGLPHARFTEVPVPIKSVLAYIYIHNTYLCDIGIYFTEYAGFELAACVAI